MASDFSAIQFSFKTRSSNIVAHSLARIDCDSISEIIWMEDGPPQCLVAVNSDILAFLAFDLISSLFDK